MDTNHTKQFLNKNKFFPSKKMGQNFLVNKNIAKAIIESIDFKDVDAIVEIGPGVGALTEIITTKTDKPIYAIELDKRLASTIKQNFAKVEVINNDVLLVDFDKLLEKYIKPILISNLPYSISSLMVKKFLTSNLSIFYCLLQKEFVERLIALPNKKEYSSLSVLLQHHCKIRKILDVNASSFMPPPKVYSAFIVLTKIRKFDREFAKFVAHCFQFRRKTLINNLKSLYSIDLITKCLQHMNFLVSVRAQELSPEEFYSFYELIKKETI